MLPPKCYWISTQVQRLATDIFRAAGRMRELLADLNSVVLGDIATAEMCDTRELIAAASNSASAAAGNGSVQIVLEVPEGIELPLIRSRMQSVFFNLIANALEAMPSGGRLHIAAQEADSCVLIEVEDTGLAFRMGFATGCSNRSSRQASETASGLGWPSPARRFSITAATFGLSPPTALVLLSDFPGIGDSACKWHNSGRIRSGNTWLTGE